MKKKHRAPSHHDPRAKVREKRLAPRIHDLKRDGKATGPTLIVINRGIIKLLENAGDMAKIHFIMAF